MSNDSKKLRIGVLSVQGAFIEHINMLKRCDAVGFEIRHPKDLNQSMDGLILPGGESTVQTKLLHELGLFSELKSMIQAGLPVFGTCAGLLLLAKDIEQDHLDNFALMDIKVKRNAYGRQLGSFMTHETFANQLVPMSFIRAPYIIQAGSDVEILSVADEKIVAARQQNMLVTAFHPELTDDLTVHKYFLDMVQNVLP